VTVLIVLLCGFAALAWVGLPLWRPAGDAAPEDDGALSRLSERRQVMYENIRDLDFEYAMGKLTDEDYHEVRQGMVEEAAGVLQELDATNRDQTLDRWIEAEVAARRRGGRDARGAGAAATVPCASCRQPNPAAASFCDGCGARLYVACPGCGARQRPGARFCGDCGKPL
jgi:hypothetical protein